MEIFHLLVIILSILLVWLLLPWLRILILGRKIPDGQFSYAVYANWKLFSGDGNFFLSILYENLKSERNNFIKCINGASLFLLIKSPQVATTVMSKYLDKAPLHDFINLHDSILFGSGSSWNIQRKILSTNFTTAALKKLFPIFDEKSKILVKNFAEKCEFDSFYPLAALTLETVLGSMGCVVDLQNADEAIRDKPVKNMNKMMSCITRRSFMFWLHSEKIYKLTKIYREEKEARKAWRGNFVEEIFKVNESFNVKLFNCGLSDKTLENTILSLNLAGQDTTAFTLSTALLMLAMHPEVQSKVYSEINDLYVVDYYSINSLVYLDAVLNEVLRLFPIVPFILRGLTKEIVLDNYKIPKGTTLAISVLNIHRIEKIWGSNARFFRPERFLKENLSEIQRQSFMPFAKGPRSCLGRVYALKLMKITLVNILKNFVIETDFKFEDIKLKIEMTLKFVDSYKIKVKKRN